MRIHFICTWYTYIHNLMVTKTKIVELSQFKHGWHFKFYYHYFIIYHVYM